MFDISFTGETINDENGLVHLGLITLGEVTEGFAASFSFWTTTNYQEQWLEAAKRLLVPDARSAFITGMYDPETANFINWWPVWRTNGFVIFQQQMLFVDAEEIDGNHGLSVARFAIDNPYASVADWDLTHSEDCRRTGVCRRPRLGKPLPNDAVDLCPSEWCVRLEDVQEFLRRRTAVWGI